MLFHMDQQTEISYECFDEIKLLVITSSIFGFHSLWLFLNLNDTPLQFGLLIHFKSFSCSYLPVHFANSLSKIRIVGSQSASPKASKQEAIN